MKRYRKRKHTNYGLIKYDDRWIKRDVIITFVPFSECAYPDVSGIFSDAYEIENVGCFFLKWEDACGQSKQEHYSSMYPFEIKSVVGKSIWKRFLNGERDSNYQFFIFKNGKTILKELNRGNMNYPLIFNRYKKRYKNLQRRLDKEQISNKRYQLLLEFVADRIEDSKLKDIVKFELEVLKYK